MKALKRIRLAAAGALAAGALATGATMFSPTLQQYKPRVFAVQATYALPNTTRPHTDETVPRTALPDTRVTLEDSVAQLIIARDQNTFLQRTHDAISNIHDAPLKRIEDVFSSGDNRTPGGYLLSKQSTRSANPLGRFTSYDPVKTRARVQELRDTLATREKNALIFDEGEGGYLQRVGTLPAMRDIAHYYDLNAIGPTLKGVVQPTTSKAARKRTVRALFDAYAGELRNAGVHAVFGPVVDLAPRNTESYVTRDDRAPTTWNLNTIDLAVEYTQAMHRRGIRVLPKHFPNIGRITSDLHKTSACVPIEALHAERGVETYRRTADILAKAGERLDGILVSHVGNPNDNCRPYSLSERAYTFIRNEKFNENQGLGMKNALVITDEIGMQAATEYVENRLNEQERTLLNGCATKEAKVAALAIRAGADGVIRNGRVDPLVTCIATIARRDERMRDAVKQAYANWETFSTNRTLYAFRDKQ